MKKILLILPLFILTLISCSKTVEANMYVIDDWYYSFNVSDYNYEILNTYEDYCSNANYSYINSYNEEYFNDNTLVLLYVYFDNEDRWALNESYIKNNTLYLEIENYQFGFIPHSMTTAYCIEVKSKDFNQVEVTKINSYLANIK